MKFLYICTFFYLKVIAESIFFFVISFYSLYEKILGFFYNKNFFVQTLPL
jgi:hypothetical protein